MYIDANFQKKTLVKQIQQCITIVLWYNICLQNARMIQYRQKSIILTGVEK